MAWYSCVRLITFSPDNGTAGTLHAWWRESNLNTCLSPDNETALVLTCCLTLDSAVAVLSLWWSWRTWRTSIDGAFEDEAHNLLECGWWWCLSKRVADEWWHPVISWDTLALFNRAEERKDGWKGGAYVTEVLKRAVVVESEQVGLTTLVQSPDVITLTSWS